MLRKHARHDLLALTLPVERKAYRAVNGIGGTVITASLVFNK
jgi:hypothetical protein